MVVFCRFISFKDMLVYLEFNIFELVKGCVGCGDGRCRICKFFVEGESFKSNVMGRSYVINFKMDCNIDYVIYLLFCSKCFK